MPGENPDPDLNAARLIAYGYNLTTSQQNAVNEYNTSSASTLVTHFFDRPGRTRLQILWETDQFP